MEATTTDMMATSTTSDNSGRLMASTTYTLAQVGTHKDATSCWTAINGLVYDVTAFIDKHPGGDKNILKTCGIDATTLFTNQHGGQEGPEMTLATFQIGILK